MRIFLFFEVFPSLPLGMAASFHLRAPGPVMIRASRTASGFVTEAWQDSYCAVVQRSEEAFSFQSHSKFQACPTLSASKEFKMHLPMLEAELDMGPTVVRTAPCLE